MMEWKRTVSGLAAVFYEGGRLAEAAGMGPAATWTESSLRRFVEARPSLTDLGDEVAAQLLEPRAGAPLGSMPELCPAVEAAIKAMDSLPDDSSLAVVEGALAAWESSLGCRAGGMRFQVAVADARGRGASKALLVTLELDGLLASALSQVADQGSSSVESPAENHVIRAAAGHALLAVDRVTAATERLLRETGTPRVASLASGAERAWVVLPDDADTHAALDRFRAELEREFLQTDAGAIQPIVAEASFAIDAIPTPGSILSQVALDVEARRRAPFVAVLADEGALGPFAGPESDEERALAWSSAEQSAVGRSKGVTSLLDPEIAPKTGVVAVIRKPGDAADLADGADWSAWMDAASWSYSDPGALKTVRVATVDLGDHRLLLGDVAAVLGALGSWSDATTRAAVRPVSDAGGWVLALLGACDDVSEAPGDPAVRSLVGGSTRLFDVVLSESDLRHSIEDGKKLAALVDRAPGAARALLDASSQIHGGELELGALARLKGRIHELAAQVRSSRDPLGDGRHVAGIRTLLRGFPAGFESGVARVALAYAVMRARELEVSDCALSAPTDLDAQEIRS